MTDSFLPGARAGQLRSPAMVGESEVFRRTCVLLQRYAACNAPVLIEGETGTGKELAAREIHYASQRSLGPFVPVNCGALPDTLLESELFGHRRGAFTDARSNEPGLVEFARGGTLFLDEVDALSTHAQTTLLRFLQNGEFRAVGERALRIADVRIVAATNRPLSSAVADGHFRRDLYYRLNPLYVCLSPLRERESDVLLLARHLLADTIGRLGLGRRRWSPEALEMLKEHDWPGNVRELENLIVRVCMRSDRELIGPEDLRLAEPAIWRECTQPEPASCKNAQVEGDAGFAAAKESAIRSFERKYLIELMQRAHGNVSRAALLSGTERRQLGKMLKRNGIGRNAATTSQNHT